MEITLIILAIGFALLFVCFEVMFFKYKKLKKELMTKDKRISEQNKRINFLEECPMEFKVLKTDIKREKFAVDVAIPYDVVKFGMLGNEEQKKFLDSVIKNSVLQKIDYKIKSYIKQNINANLICADEYTYHATSEFEIAIINEAI